MSLRLVVDMNLSPEWATAFAGAGDAAVHWSAVGPATTPDAAIMAWARDTGRAVLTHDLDFGTLLAATNARAPSAVLLRGEDVLPDHRGPAVLAAIDRHRAALAAGALLVIDLRRSRVRLLPLHPPAGA